MMWDFHGYGGIVAIRDGKWKAMRRKLEKVSLPTGSCTISLMIPVKPWTSPNSIRKSSSDWNLAYIENRTAEPDFPSTDL